MFSRFRSCAFIHQRSAGYGSGGAGVEAEGALIPPGSSHKACLPIAARPLLMLWSENVTPGVHQSQGVVLIAGEHATVRQDFVNSAERHAEIQIVQWAAAQNPALPACLIGEFFA